MTAITAFVLCLALGLDLPSNRSGVHAQTGSATSESLTLNQILDRYVQALGGKAAFEKLTSRLTVQSVTGRGEEEKVEVYEKAPNKRLIVITYDSVGQIMSGCDGAVGWTKNLGSVQEMQDLERAFF